jgi:hypothetical protein
MRSKSIMGSNAKTDDDEVIAGSTMLGFLGGGAIGLGTGLIWGALKAGFFAAFCVGVGGGLLGAGLGAFGGFLFGAYACYKADQEKMQKARWR